MKTVKHQSMFCTIQCKDFATFALFCINDPTASYEEMTRRRAVSGLIVVTIDLLLCFNFLSMVKCDKVQVLCLSETITLRALHCFS